LGTGAPGTWVSLTVVHYNADFDTAATVLLPAPLGATTRERLARSSRTDISWIMSIIHQTSQKLQADRMIGSDVIRKYETST
jgi:hypothetical protein